ncbi:MAG: gephyrin-like molybdotransferase Glp [Anaerolineales bacterium]|jgi:molybdopterin molybdotransferase
MPEFLKLLPPTEALELLLQTLPDLGPATEMIGTPQALGRVTASDVYAHQPLPSFARSTMDGYALRARDSYGASESMPAYLTVVGEVPMGAATAFRLTSGQAAVIHTGGMLPEGADAVVMLEQTQAVGRGEVEILKAVAEGENVLLVGEDVAEGQLVLPAGTRIRPPEVGGCMALGISDLRVAKIPTVGIISSGDEIISAYSLPGPGQVRDVNSYSLAALVTQTGGSPVLYGIVPDRLESLRSAAGKALQECDVTVITAGSSASVRDMTSETIRTLGKPGVLVHGVNVRPGKPTILAVCNGKAVVGLPGNPVSALVIASLFVVPVIEKLLGLKVRRPRARLQAILMTNIASQAGREDWVAVKVTSSGTGWQAEPIFAKSNLIFSLVQADGLIRIQPDVTGFSAGEVVEVYLY